MEDRFDLYRDSHSDDGYGGQASSSALVVAGVLCMVQSGAEHEQSQALEGIMVGMHLFTVTMPAELDIRYRDEIVITSKDDLRLRVQAVLDPETREIMRRVIASTQL
jgi:hypothetical protein